MALSQQTYKNISKYKKMKSLIATILAIQYPSPVLVVVVRSK